MKDKKTLIWVVMALSIYSTGLSATVWGQEEKKQTEDVKLLQVKIEKLEKTIKSQQEMIDKLNKELAKQSQKIKPLEAEILELQEENTKLKERIKGFISSEKKNRAENVVPFTGEEIPLTKVKAYPEDYIGKPFVVIGGIQVSDYYNYRYENAKKTHISLNFNELRQNMSRTYVGMDLYVRREISKKLVEEITKIVDAGYQSKLIRAKVCMLPKRYSREYSGIMAELIDWQFLSPDKKSWQDWVVGGGLAKTDSNLSGGIIYHGEKRDKKWFGRMYERFHDKIAFVDGKYIDLQKSNEVIAGLYNSRVYEVLGDGEILVSWGTKIIHISGLKGEFVDDELFYIPEDTRLIPGPIYKDGSRTLRSYTAFKKGLTRAQFAEALRKGFELVVYRKIGKRTIKRPVP